MEASALTQTPALAARSPLLRLQSDEKLVALTRRGNHGAFEALVDRYNSRLLAFCRHMLASTEDAEDVLQEVFTAAFNAICADDRPINARPWLYRIARNRCLNHLRRPQHAGQDSMDVFERDGGATTADTVHTREEFRQIVADVQDLPETQRTALLLREIDALSYEQIAEAMDTTVPSVKSLLVRARVSLAEAAEARLLTCAEVRLELGQVAEGIARTSAPVRRHVRTCERCKIFKRELRNTGRALAAVYPVGGLVVIKKFVLAKLGAAGGGAAASSAAAGGAAAGGGAAVGGAGIAGAGAVASSTAGGVISAGVSAVATKAAAGLAAAAIVTAGAVEVKHASHPAHPASFARSVPAQPAQVEPQVVAAEPQQVAAPVHRARHASKPKKAAVQKTPAQPTPAPTTTTPAATTPVAPVQTDQGGSTVALPQQGSTGPSGTESDPTATGGTPQPSGSQPAPTTPSDPTQPPPASTDPSSTPPPPPSDSDPSSTEPQPTPPPGQ
ncbi:MAG TPA: sigma-70 family RNA polymerase sigma factor [Thermoleophilaceae bacterium]